VPTGLETHEEPKGNNGESVLILSGKGPNYGYCFFGKSGFGIHS
jgi:hypothetical protein